MKRVAGFLVCLLWFFTLGHCLAESIQVHHEVPVPGHHHHHHSNSHDAAADPVSHSNGEHGDACEIAMCKPESTTVFKQYEGLCHSTPPLFSVSIPGLSATCLSSFLFKTRSGENTSSIISSLTRSLALAPNAPPMTL